MKSRYPWTLAITVGSAIGIVAALGTVMNGSEKSELVLQTSIDHRPPDREGPLGGYASIVDDVSPSVVSVFSTKRAKPMPRLDAFPFDLPGFPPFGLQRGRSTPQDGLGSGVVLSESGYILTNNHVVEGAEEIKIALDDDGEPYEANVVGRDPLSDLAVLKIDAKGLTPAMLGDSNLLRAGDTVLAIGNPFGLSKTVTSGIVSATGRTNVGIVGYENFIQTDASINPGNSGGALVDNRGRVMGINTAILSRTGGNVGIGFAIPINLAVKVADQLIDQGSVKRGYLGVMLGELTPDLAKALDIEEEGVLVNEVLAMTPASKAGMMPGDVIVRFNDKPVSDVPSLRFMVGDTRPDSEAEFTVVRDGSTREVKVTIGHLADADLKHSPIQEDERFLEGMELKELTEPLRKQLNVSDAIEGVVITSVDPTSRAAKAGLKAGDVITEVARTPVRTLQDVKEAKANASSDMLLLRVANAGGQRFVAMNLS